MIGHECRQPAVGSAERDRKLKLEREQKITSKEREVKVQKQALSRQEEKGTGSELWRLSIIEHWKRRR
jgi:hypothetical protein